MRIRIHAIREEFYHDPTEVEAYEMWERMRNTPSHYPPSKPKEPQRRRQLVAEMATVDPPEDLINFNLGRVDLHLALADLPEGSQLGDEFDLILRKVEK